MKKPIMTLPCKFSIEDFTKNPTGFHCQNCDKVLHDFRNSSSEQINSVLSSNKKESVCGVFSKNQLQSKTNFLNLSLWNSRVSLSLLGLLGFVGPAVVSCSSEEKPMEEKKQMAFNVLKFPMRLKGSVRDQISNAVIPNAEIKIIQNGKIIRTVNSDENGAFDFYLQKSDLLNETFDLVFKSNKFVADTLDNLTFEEAKTKRIVLQLNANAEEKVKINYATVGEVACETISGVPAPEPVYAGITIEEPLPEPPVEIGKIIAPDPPKVEEPVPQKESRKTRRKRN